MWQDVFSTGLAVSVLVSAASCSGTPVLAQRATTTLTPITITGNGKFSFLTQE
jgi:hypothetical protein